ncbi:MATE family efflux transporter [Alteribacillus sp. HJP-4]|uniref:MATE family efflux transporter n=1 Tax=Alteribacillus sp. HJP-4 TaxID=2775394 RepID=UPI0035CD0167
MILAYFREGGEKGEDKIIPKFAAEKYEEKTHRHYLALALPLIIATISTPLLGAVDTAVVGYLEAPHYLGGVAVAALIFNTMYWVLGFLRVSTSGFTAQAEGRRNERELQLLLIRPSMIAIAAGLIFVLFQVPIREAAMILINPTAAVRAEAEAYFLFRIWGAPFALLQFVFLGWLIGKARVNAVLVLQFGCNLLNIVLDFIFVFSFHMGAAGVGLATLLAEFIGVVIAAWYIFHNTSFRFSSTHWKEVLEKDPFLHLIKVNRDLFIRTLCLLAVFGIFVSMGTSYGEVILAANAVLLQIHFMMAYVFDGLANASSILSGKAVGKKDKYLFTRTMKLGALWSFAAAAVWMLIMIFGGHVIIGLFTSIASVQETALNYSIWIVFFPLTGFWGLQLYGIFTGATCTTSIRNSMIVSLLVFLGALYFWGGDNQGLWLAFTLFSLARSLVLWMYVPTLIHHTFPTYIRTDRQAIIKN